MPGLHTLVTVGNSEGVQKNIPIFRKKLEEMRYCPNYTSNLLVDTNDFMLGFSGYSDYPVQIFNGKNQIIASDSCIYNMDEEEIRKHLLSFSLNKQNIEHIRNIALRIMDVCEPSQEYFNIAATREILTSERSDQRLSNLLTLLLYTSIMG